MDTKNKIIKIVFIFIIYLITSAGFAQTGWFVQNSGITNDLSYVNFLNENTGFAGNPFIKTTNGGFNWLLVSGAPSINMPSFVDNYTGYAANETIYKTTDCGNNWYNLSNTYKQWLFFVDRDTGYSSGINYLGGYTAVDKTTNGGMTWYEILRESNAPSWTFNYGKIMFVLPNKGYLIRWIHVQSGWRVGSIWKTENYGSNWSSVISLSSYFIEDMDFPAIDTGFFVENYYDINYIDNNGYIYKGVNDSWSLQYVHNKKLRGIHFSDANTGYAVGDTGSILKTTNGGMNWVSQISPVVNNLSRVFFINPNTGFIVGTNGIILKTTSAGEPTYTISGTIRYQDNNQPVTSGYVKALRYDVQTQNVITVDSTGINSNGTYMLPQCPPEELDIMAFQDDEEDMMFVPTYYISTIYWENATHVTPDTNLTNIDIGVYRINNSADNKHIGGMVYKANEEDLAVLKDAIVYARIGNVFKGYSITGSTGSYCVDSLSAGNYEVICNRMGFYSAVRPFQLTTFSVDTIDFVLNTLLVSIEPNLQNIPEKYWLSQNYPNPFNPVTKIKFSVPELSFVKLMIFDITGRELSVIVNGEMKPGIYEADWDGSNFSSGVYFYRLESDKYSETRKMVLIK